MKQSTLDTTFHISLILKGLDGLLEIVGGVLLLFISPDTINRLVMSLTQHELQTDSHDLLATHLRQAAQHLTSGAALFGALYLLSHGLVKVILVIAVYKEHLWAYPWMIGFLVIFILYQLYRLAIQFSVGLFLLTVFDIFIVWLTALEYRRHKARAQPI